MSLVRRCLHSLGMALALYATASCAIGGRDTPWMDMSISMLTLGGDHPCYIFLRGETTLAEATSCLAASAPPGRSHTRVSHLASASAVVEEWIVWPDVSHRLTVRLTFAPSADGVFRINRVEFGTFVHATAPAP